MASFGSSSSSATYCRHLLQSPHSHNSTTPRTTISMISSLTPSGTTSMAAFSLYPSTTFLNRPRFRPLTLAPSFSPIGLVSPLGASRSSNAKPSSDSARKEAAKSEVKEGEEEVEEELPWIEEKALDLVEFTGSVTQAIPGPRVGSSSLPWILAVPLAYVGITFVFAVVKTIKKFNSPREIRKKLVNKNAYLCKSIDELFEKGRDAVQESAMKELMQKTGFGMDEILRKYIRYALNEKPFNADLISNLIFLRKASLLDDSQVSDILNDISRRIVKDKGPVVMDAAGYTERGFQRKLAVQALFGKVYYLSELPEFCSKDDGSLVVKEIFGVADEDAEKLRLVTLSEAGDLQSLEEKLGGSSNTEDASDGTP